MELDAFLMGSGMLPVGLYGFLLGFEFALFTSHTNQRGLVGLKEEI